MNGEVLRSKSIQKYYKLAALIVVLIFVYILGGYHSMQQHRRLSDLKKEVKDIKFEYLTTSAERSELTRQSQVVQELRERNSDLKENKTPVMVVE